MFKRILSYVLILSIFNSTMASCGSTGSRDQGDDDRVTARTPLKRRPPALAPVTNDSSLTNFGAFSINSYLLADPEDPDIPEISAKFDVVAGAQKVQVHPPVPQPQTPGGISLNSWEGGEDFSREPKDAGSTKAKSKEGPSTESPRTDITGTSSNGPSGSPSSSTPGSDSPPAELSGSHESDSQGNPSPKKPLGTTSGNRPESYTPTTDLSLSGSQDSGSQGEGSPEKILGASSAKRTSFPFSSSPGGFASIVGSSSPEDQPGTFPKTNSPFSVSPRNKGLSSLGDLHRIEVHDGTETAPLTPEKGASLGLFGSNASLRGGQEITPSPLTLSKDSENLTASQEIFLSPRPGEASDSDGLYFKGEGERDLTNKRRSVVFGDPVPFSESSDEDCKGWFDIGQTQDQENQTGAPGDQTLNINDHSSKESEESSSEEGLLLKGAQAPAPNAQAQGPGGSPQPNKMKEPETEGLVAVGGRARAQFTSGPEPEKPRVPRFSIQSGGTQMDGAPSGVTGVAPVNGVMGDGEGGDGKSPYIVVPLGEEGEKLDPKVIAFLEYAKDYIIDGKITLRQGLVAGIGGTLIGVGVGNAMPPIFDDGLDKLGSKFHYELNIDDTVSNLFTVHTAVTLGIDSISRNMMILANLTGPSMEEFSIAPHKIKVKYVDVTIDPRKVSLIFVYLGAGMAALLPVYYLWHVEKENWEYDPENSESYLTFFECLAPTLFLDASLLNGRAAKQWVDEKFNAYLIRQAFAGTHLSTARLIRETELDRCRDLARLFRYIPDDEIHDLYEKILVDGFQQESEMDLPEGNIKAEDALRTLCVLRQIHQDYQMPEALKEDWKKRTAKTLGWGLPTFALAGRSLVFFQIIYDLLNELSPENVFLNTGFSIIFGEIIAAFFQGKVELDATEAAVYDLLGGEDLEGDSSHNCFRNGLRKIGKGYNYLQGAWNTMPYLLVGIKVTYGWPVFWRVSSLLFFGLADMFSNAVSFTESYGGAISGAESLLSYQYATATYKRNKLRRMVFRYHQAFETMDPEALIKVTTLRDSCPLTSRK